MQPHVIAIADGLLFLLLPILPFAFPRVLSRARYPFPSARSAWASMPDFRDPAQSMPCRESCLCAQASVTEADFTKNGDGSRWSLLLLFL